VPLIVAMGKAAELARKHLPEYEEKVGPLRDKLEEAILSSVPDTELNGCLWIRRPEFEVPQESVEKLTQIAIKSYHQCRLWNLTTLAATENTR
jgi:cysteine sulfinate desulfinase/cysteine desulfurase-like protein